MRAIGGESVEEVSKILSMMVQMDGESAKFLQRNRTSSDVDAGQSKDIGHSQEELMLMS